ncbi:hypothetical protein LTR36_009128 [Oleoguttula mirabilis]|uniref:Uncharacterized protein n=1 Tax=Oleoguttula mirabilis TaxID=1507867 RepID=A0AAV9J6T1_9PEZI|nr:hypothetical protein LTR36_009128 [Oleoguttula mirabilis]
MDLHRGKVPPWLIVRGPQLAGNPSIPNGSACRLLELPPELRNYIYELVVTRNGPIDMRPRSWSLDGLPEIELRQPALAGTCKQIRAEALATFYSLNVFEQTFEIGGWLNDGESLAAYLDAMGVEFCRCLTKVRILFVFREYPNPAPLLPWVKLFCRGSRCMPPQGVFELSAVTKPVEGPKWAHLEWVDDLMKDLEALGWHMFEADELNLDMRTDLRIKRAMRHWLAGVERQEYKQLIGSLDRETRSDVGSSDDETRNDGGYQRRSRKRRRDRRDRRD